MKKVLGIFLILTIASNLTLLNIYVFHPPKNPPKVAGITLPFQIPNPTLTPSLPFLPIQREMSGSEGSGMDPALKAYIDNALQRLAPTLIAELPTSVPLSIGGTAPFSTGTTTSAKHEYFIPLGSGSTQKDSWDDLTSTDTQVDTSSYGTILEAYFTVQISNPTQNGIVETRLYNATDGYVVYGTQLTLDGPPSATYTAGPFSFPTGKKTYRIQLRSGLSAPASAANAKIKLIAR